MRHIIADQDLNGITIDDAVVIVRENFSAVDCKFVNTVFVCADESTADELRRAFGPEVHKSRIIVGGMAEAIYILALGSTGDA